MRFEDIASLDLNIARQLIPAWLGGFIEAPPDATAQFVSQMQGAIDATSDEELRALLHALATAGDDYRLYPAAVAARRLSRACMGTLVREREVTGIDALRAAVRSGPTLLLSNHLSYVDTQLTDLLLTDAGASDIADVIVAIAGPKVYGTPFRRMAACCLNTLKTAQSTTLVHNEAGLSPREVARIALQTIQDARGLMAQGHPILIYAEGSRTRTGHLQPFLRAVSRYAALPGVKVVPVAIGESDAIFPIDAEAMRPGTVRLAFGEPIDAAALGAREAVEATWRSIAALLPERHRPTEDTPPIV